MGNNCNCMNSEKEDLLREIQECTFYVIELALYLDINPEDQRALCLHNKHANHLRKITDKYDFVCANILHNILAEIMPDLKNIMKPDAKMVLSGILDEKKNIVLDAVDKENLQVIEILHQDQWVAIVVTNTL